MMTSLLIVLGVLLVLAAFVLGYIVGIRKIRYDGYFNISEKDPSKVFQLDLNTQPEELKEQVRITLKVRKVPDLKNSQELHSL
jgi:hypothetical protein